jgi:hypothetical protein
MSILDPDSDISVITRRDKNATAALPEIIRSCVYDTCEQGEMRHEMFARKAYATADAMERHRTKF